MFLTHTRQEVMAVLTYLERRRRSTAEQRLAMVRERFERDRAYITRPQPVNGADQLLMRSSDELHMEYPFAGARMLARPLRREGYEMGRRRVRTMTMMKWSTNPGHCVKFLRASSLSPMPLPIIP